MEVSWTLEAIASGMAVDFRNNVVYPGMGSVWNGVVCVIFGVGVHFYQAICL